MLRRQRRYVESVLRQALLFFCVLEVAGRGYGVGNPGANARYHPYAR